MMINSMLIPQNGQLSNIIVSKLLNAGRIPTVSYTVDLASIRVFLVFVNKLRDMEHFRRLFSELIPIESILSQKKTQIQQHAPVQSL
jgi:hypothetical protein